MGLCKCPKRKVTNLFCFEHRVNVCESCLISNHESCVVQTYVSWLTDSDFDPNCLLCTQPLNRSETIRLKCLHLFHWSCLNARLSQLANGTTPANYKCPSCLDTVFPVPNQTSPIVEKLKSKLATVNWGRIGVGLEPSPEYETHAPVQMQLSNGNLQQSSPPSGRATPIIQRDSAYSVNIEHPIESVAFTSRAKSHAEDRRPLIDQPKDEDHPDQKYAKRFGGDRHIKIRSVPRSVKRYAVLAMIVAVLILLFYYMRSSNRSADDNPLFDPHANPNIRIADS